MIMSYILQVINLSVHTHFSALFTSLGGRSQYYCQHLCIPTGSSGQRPMNYTVMKNVYLFGERFIKTNSAA